jgi:hypothetical protein
MPTDTIPSKEKLRELALEFIKNKRSYKQLTKDGELEEYLDLTVESCERYANNLIETGIEKGEAWKQAINQEIFGREE